MIALRLDRWLVFKKADVSQDSTGERILDFDSPLETHRVRGERVTLRGTEKFAAKQNIAEGFAQFRIRWPMTWTPSPTETWRLYDTTDGDRSYDITGVDPMAGRRSGLEVSATARAE
jgi:head-tail adaptor